MDERLDELLVGEMGESDEAAVEVFVTGETGEGDAKGKLMVC